MEVSNVHLSESELGLFCSADLILTKNAIIKKVIGLLEDLQKEIYSQDNTNIIMTTPPKITKGENYQGLPFVILDYPRKTSGEEICFIRSMFWWGKFYSSTLHISGKYKEGKEERISNYYDQLAGSNYYVSINFDQWVHHFEPSNYKAISATSKAEFESILTELPHIKIAAKWPLEEMAVANTRLKESWNLLLNLISEPVK